LPPTRFALVRMRSLAGVLLVLALALPGCAVPGPGLPAAERGRRLAERTGCFACHGPEGLRGAGNPGRPERRVPGYGDVRKVGG